ncbi:tetratricopeptide repeat protein [Aspergillus homomorphus CBS 101889]|uniref:TPR-like protein n=1 Tax=Aspergillus homomorphus (strain CBS 101889) TaxID=1450537 RepID=A0A395I349_ASPHC|nr:TPR-like protein [Aspergillus homomorphus CBS 101889]RAL14119.1 TPR-like protein [Aspergillus homomorphus CBS 101889]
MSQEEYFDLGTYHRPVTTTSTTSQTWFNRGLIWMYAFNHEESARCFERAIEADEACAMAYWGLAYAIGANYNKPWSFFDDLDLATVVKRGHAAAKKAESYASKVSAVETALIKAIQSRYPEEIPTKPFSAWNEDFAQAMEAVHREFPDDLDVITTYADALMNLKPWDLWDLKTGQPTEGAPTLKTKAIIDRALMLDGALKHPGLLHLYIHLMEMSPEPEAALPIANHLRGLVPDGGHLHHMPTHLDIICGRYDQAITWNSAAIEADEKYHQRVGPLNFYTLYRAHDYHFRIYAAMFSGRYQVAIDTVQRLEASIPESLLRVESPPMADWLEAFLSVRLHVLIRFGRWDEIIQLALPSDESLYSMTTAITHYAKTVAYAATGQVVEARAQRHHFCLAVQRVQPSRTLFNNQCLKILDIAFAMLEGELQYREGEFDAAFSSLRRAIELEDNLPYDEPWGWMQPTRHAYGALLMEQGHVQQALDVYMADLGMTEALPRALRHPNNVWALHGVHECFVALGKVEEAKKIESQVRTAVAAADVPIRASCFCRLEV